MASDLSLHCLQRPISVPILRVITLYCLQCRLGLDPKMLAKILNMSSGRCWSSDTYNPCPGVIEGVPSSNNYKGGFGTALMTKVSKVKWKHIQGRQICQIVFGSVLKRGLFYFLRFFPLTLVLLNKSRCHAHF